MKMQREAKSQTKFIFRLLWLFTFPVLLATVVGYFGRYYWIADLFSHFKWQYFWILILSAIGFMIIEKSRNMVILLPFILLNAFEVLKVYLPEEKSGVTDQTIRIASINLLDTNQEIKKVGQFIVENNPDILLLMEYTPKWHDSLAESLEDFSYRADTQRTDHFGIAIYSKIKPAELKIIEAGQSMMPSVYYRSKMHGKWVTLIGTHPLPPDSHSNFVSRNRQLSEIARLISGSGGESILLGDLNVSPYSYYFKNLIHESGLRDTRKGFGIQPTWPTYFQPLQIPLDHCLVSPGIQCINRELGESIGSDHRPIVVDIYLNLPQNPSETTREKKD